MMVSWSVKKIFLVAITITLLFWIMFKSYVIDLNDEYYNKIVYGFMIEERRIKLVKVILTTDMRLEIYFSHHHFASSQNRLPWQKFECESICFISCVSKGRFGLISKVVGIIAAHCYIICSGKLNVLLGPIYNVAIARGCLTAPGTKKVRRVLNGQMIES
ncbi:uncharacterized protein EV154DRAFT_480167 [Mucor mucedo]|uniref:uncharacterized protein n=1 Tax=Mucor mucedo TaxID=29922 RepID=UPI00221EC07D|nr:uncharacterized protein EV154DRAFT_480167 [Mucor mucedo]KAI7892676.1 hypothetical protein EV154DRAFT_480167 [Mucor mucedo]